MASPLTNTSNMYGRRRIVCKLESRGLAFLMERAGRLEYETSCGQTVPENFCAVAHFGRHQGRSKRCSLPSFRCFLPSGSSLSGRAPLHRKLLNYVHRSRTWNLTSKGVLLT